VGAAAIGNATRTVNRRQPVLGNKRSSSFARVQVQIDGIELESWPTQPGLRAQLSPGEFSVSIRLTETSDRQGHTFELSGSTDFRLAWCGDQQIKVAEEFSDSVSPEMLAASSAGFKFTLLIPEHVSISTGTLQLHHISAGVRGTLDLVAGEIAGKYFAAPAEVAKKLRVDLAPIPDPSLAVLHISARDTRLEVIGYHPAVPLLSVSIPQPPLSLADADEEQPSRKVYKKVIEYCRGNIPEVIRWLNAVLSKTQRNVSIVIVEHADSRVPWEMLMLRDNDEPLGAQVVVTRWTTVQFYDQSVSLKPRNDSRLEGLVVHFVDSDALPNADSETQELALCRQIHCETTAALEEKLENLPSGTAMVFMSSHGTFAGNSGHVDALGELGTGNGRLTTLSLEGLPTPQRRPTLVINACHSARIFRTEGGVTGFPELFLASFAHSYLGTLGAVDEAVAAEVGMKLLRAARAPEGIDIAQFLLQLRREAAATYRAAGAARVLVSKFMYVYYGPIVGTLRLMPAATA
jgi:hypothetical protein